MTNETLDSSIINWVNTFKLKNSVKTIEDLYDGVVFSEILNDINNVWFKASQSNVGENNENWVVVFNRLKKIYSLIIGFYTEELGQSIVEIETPNFNSIAKNKDSHEIIKFAQLILVLAVQSEKNKEYIQKITSLNQSSQQWLMISIEEIMDKLSKVNDFSDGLIDDPSQNEVTIKLLKAERDELYEKKKELSDKLESVKRENIRISEQKKILEDRIKYFEEQMEVEDKLGKNDSILKSEISNLKNQLDLSEDKCQEMELLNEQKQKTIDSLEKRIVEISKKAEEAGLLKDKMDEFDHMKSLLNNSEKIAARYKRKLEDNQLLLKEIKDLQKERKEQSEKNQELKVENAKYTNLKLLTKEYKAKIIALEAKNNELLEELKRIQNEINNNEEKIRKLEEINEESVDLIQELEEKLSNMMLINENNEFNIQTQINNSKELELKMKIANLEEQLYSKNPTELEARIKDITKLKEKFENDYMTVYQENLKLKGELNQNTDDGGMDSDSRKIIDKYKEEIYQLNNKLKNYESINKIDLYKENNYIRDTPTRGSEDSYFYNNNRNKLLNYHNYKGHSNSVNSLNSSTVINHIGGYDNLNMPYTSNLAEYTNGTTNNNSNTNSSNHILNSNDRYNLSNNEVTTTTTAITTNGTITTVVSESSNNRNSNSRLGLSNIYSQNPYSVSISPTTVTAEPSSTTMNSVTVKPSQQYITNRSYYDYQYDNKIHYANPSYRKEMNNTFSNNNSNNLPAHAISYFQQYHPINATTRLSTDVYTTSGFTFK